MLKLTVLVPLTKIWSSISSKSIKFGTCSSSKVQLVLKSSPSNQSPSSVHAAFREKFVFHVSCLGLIKGMTEKFVALLATHSQTYHTLKEVSQFCCKVLGRSTWGPGIIAENSNLLMSSWWEPDTWREPPATHEIHKTRQHLLNLLAQPWLRMQKNS